MLILIKVFKKFCRSNWLVGSFLFFIIIVYYQNFLGYFIGGDDIWLYLSAPDNFSRLKELFLDIGGTYRPISFSLFRLYWLFGRNVQLMHAVPIILHGLNTVLIYFLLQKFNQSKLVSGAVGLVYGLSHIVFFDVFALTGLVDQVFLVFFLGSLLTFFNQQITVSFIFFLLTLFSKESFISLTIILTAALFLFPRFKKHKKDRDFGKFRSRIKTLTLFWLPTVVVFILKIIFYRQQGSAYTYIFGFKTLLSNLFDYGLWLINWRHGWQMGMPLPVFGYETLSFLYCLFLIFAVVKVFKTERKTFIFSLIFGLAGLMPFYFLNRALTFYLEITLIGLCILLACFIKYVKHKNLHLVLLLFFTFYFSLNIKPQWLEYSHAARGARLAKDFYDQVVQAYDWNNYDRLCLLDLDNYSHWATAGAQELNMFFKRVDGKKIEIILATNGAGLFDCPEQSLLIQQTGNKFVNLKY